MKSLLISVFRWIAVLPGAILGAFLFTFPLHWVLMASIGTDPEGDATITMPREDRDNLERTLTPLFTTFGFVFAGSVVAPRYHMIVAILLVVLWIAIPYILMSYFQREFEMGWFAHTIRAFGCLAAVVATYLKYSSESESSARNDSQGGPSTDGDDEVAKAET